MTVTKAFGLPRDCLAGMTRSEFLDRVPRVASWESVIQRSPEVVLEVKMSLNTQITLSMATVISLCLQWTKWTGSRNSKLHYRSFEIMLLNQTNKVKCLNQNKTTKMLKIHLKIIKSWLLSAVVFMLLILFLILQKYDIKMTKHLVIKRKYIV